MDYAAANSVSGTRILRHGSVLLHDKDQASNVVHKADEALVGLSFVHHKKELLKAKHVELLHDPSGDAPEHQPLDKPALSNCRGLAHIVFFDPISILLICWPLGIAASFFGWSDIWKFWLNFIAMVPLAKILGDATEELAAGLNNDTLGGLLNATFGNAVEMILTLQTMRAGQIEVVKGTLLGSIISNILLVLGMSFFCGGLTPVDGKFRGKQQIFSSDAALTNFTMLFVAMASFALPSIFLSTHDYARKNSEVCLIISRWCSIYIMIAYIAFLIFQLYSHIDIFQGGEDEEAQAQLSVCVSLCLLCVTTGFVAFSSELLVQSIDGLCEEWQLGRQFIGIILLPIVGNACEHVGAVRMAMIEKLDITIGIAVGSSTQIALFVIPSSVLLGWVIDQPMDLNLGTMETAVMVFAILIAFSVITDGNSHWLEGFMLMITYFVIATLYWFVPDEG